MRIGLGCNFIEPALCLGKLDGIGNYTQELYHQLKNNGEQIIPVVFPTFNNRHPQCQLPNTYVMKTPYSLAAACSALLHHDIAGTKKLAKKIDIYHCTDYLIPPIKDIPLVATIHDAVKIQYPDWNKSRWRTIKSLGLKKAVRWANHYITSSYAVVPELQEYFGINPQDISVVHTAIADYWFEQIALSHKQVVLSQYQINPDFILFAGTFQPRKNIRRILQAYKTLPAAIQKAHPLVLVGQRGWIEEEVIHEIQHLNNLGILHWLNYVSTYELRCLYQCAKLFLYPSLHEGFGLPILEAFASEVPVITSNITAMPEVASNAAWLVDPYSEEAIRDGILALINSPTKCQELVIKGKERVKTFTWSKCRDGIVNVYKKLL